MTNPHAKHLGRLGGSKTSPAKTAASRENGRLGGRPRILTAYEAGFITGRRGQGFVNPYPDGSEDWDNYQAGYNAGMREACFGDGSGTQRRVKPLKNAQNKAAGSGNTGEANG